MHDSSAPAFIGPRNSGYHGDSYPAATSSSASKISPLPAPLPPTATEGTNSNSFYSTSYKQPPLYLQPVPYSFGGSKSVSINQQPLSNAGSSVPSPQQQQGFPSSSQFMKRQPSAKSDYENLPASHALVSVQQKPKPPPLIGPKPSLGRKPFNT